MQIFLSYSSQDRNRLQPLIDDLEEFGAEVWFDQALTGGQEWWQEILNQMRNSELVAVALTETSIASEACQLEVKYAHDLGKPIVPIRLEPVNTMAAPQPFPSLQWVDYLEARKLEAIRVLRAVATTPRGPAPDVLPPEPPAPGHYFAELRARVDTDTDLSKPDQIGLVFELESNLRVEARRSHAVQMLQLLRARDDLNAQVADKIDDVLAKAPTDSPEEADSAPTDQEVDKDERRTALLAALASHGGESDVYVGNDIPTKKMVNGRRQAEVPDEEEVVGLINMTVFGSGKDAMLFGLDGVYFHNSVAAEPTRRAWKYDEMDADQISGDGTDLTIGDTTFYAGGGPLMEVMVAIVQDVVRAANNG